MIEIEIKIPDEVEVEKDLDTVKISGPEGKVDFEVDYPGVSFEARGEEVALQSTRDRRKPLSVIQTYETKLRNAFEGVTEGWEYTMKAVYSHFPMQVEVKGGEVEVRNFLGEKHPRSTSVIGDSEVDVSDDEITVSGPDKEHVGQTAANIEQLTYINDKDIRAFQDGIYITDKPGKEEV
ncbi:MAG: 50S ribosomal protein L6 [Halobacteria archaeon]